METKQQTYIELAATCDASFFNWRGKTRIQIKETEKTLVEISEVDTTEVLRGVSYLVRNICQDSERNETHTRILLDLLTVMEANLQKVSA